MGWERNNVRRISIKWKNGVVSNYPIKKFALSRLKYIMAKVLIYHWISIYLDYVHRSF